GNANGSWGGPAVASPAGCRPTSCQPTAYPTVVRRADRSGPNGREIVENRRGSTAGRTPEEFTPRAARGPDFPAVFPPLAQGPDARTRHAGRLRQPAGQ